MRYSLHTDAGHRYELNEDVARCDVGAGLALVADGMGGHPAGEVASEIAATVVLDRAGNGGDLIAALGAAHREIIEVASRSEGCAGMGTTMVAVRIVGDVATIVWVGDSRAYLWRGNQLRRVTTDHSFMQLLLAEQRITPEEARRHPQRNVVTQVLGVGEPKPDILRMTLEPGDWLVLCTDGLNDELTDGEITALLAASGDFSSIANTLVQAACDAGGRDNVTALVLAPEVTPARHAEVPAAAAAPAARRRPTAGLAWLVAGAAVLVSIWFLFGR